jgi:hypothetical protein
VSSNLTASASTVCIVSASTVQQQCIKVLRRFALVEARSLLTEVQKISACAPFRHLITPGGVRMSVAIDELPRGRLVF